MRQLRTAAQARGPNRGPLRQIHQPSHGGRDKAIAHIFARQVAIQDQARRLHRGHIFHRMHGDVDAAVQQGLFNLAGEQALAANLFQRLVQNLVAGDFDHHDLKRRFGQGIGGHKTAPHLVRLPKRKRRAARADFERLGGGGKCVCHAIGISLSFCPDNCHNAMLNRSHRTDGA